jgi:hypothetical protein
MYLSGLRVGGVVSDAKRVVIRAAVGPYSAMFGVRRASAPMRSSYQRQLVEPAIAGREAVIELTEPGGKTAVAFASAEVVRRRQEQIIPIDRILCMGIP